jgi:hypothetical protein
VSGFGCEAAHGSQRNKLIVTALLASALSGRRQQAHTEQMLWECRGFYACRMQIFGTISTFGEPASANKSDSALVVG